MGAQERLQVLLAEQANKVCADCGARAPRYASTTFAVFLCNRCFGVHRGLGTHISKTRSVRSKTCAGHIPDACVRVWPGQANRRASEQAGALLHTCASLGCAVFLTLVTIPG